MLRYALGCLLEGFTFPALLGFHILGGFGCCREGGNFVDDGELGENWQLNSFWARGVSFFLSSLKGALEKKCALETEARSDLLVLAISKSPTPTRASP